MFPKLAKGSILFYFSNHTVLQPYNLSMVNSSKKILSSNKLSKYFHQNNQNKICAVKHHGRNIFRQFATKLSWISRNHYNLNHVLRLAAQKMKQKGKKNHNNNNNTI